MSSSNTGPTFQPANSQNFPRADEATDRAIDDMATQTQAQFTALLQQMDAFQTQAAALFEGPNALQGQRASRYRDQTLPQLKSIFADAHDNLSNIQSTLHEYAIELRDPFIPKATSDLEYSSMMVLQTFLGADAVQNVAHSMVVGEIDASGGFWGTIRSWLGGIVDTALSLFGQPPECEELLQYALQTMQQYENTTGQTISNWLSSGGAVWNAAVHASSPQTALTTPNIPGGGGPGANIPNIGGIPPVGGIPPIGGAPPGGPVPPVGGGNPPGGAPGSGGGVGGGTGGFGGGIGHGAPVPVAALAGTWLDKPGATNQFPEPQNMEDIAKEVIRSQGGKFRLLLLTRFGRHDQNNWLVTIPDQGNNNPTQDPGDPGIKPDVGTILQPGAASLGAPGTAGAQGITAGVGNTLPAPVAPTDPNSFLNNAQATQTEFSGKLSAYGQFVAQAIQQYCSPKAPDQPTSPLHPADIWLVGHGLGGMVAQNLASQVPFPGDNAHLSGAHVVKSVVAFGCPIVGVAAKGVSYDYYEIAGDRVGDIPVSSGVNDSRAHDIHTLSNPFTSPPWQSTNPGGPDYVKDPNDPAVIHGGYADSAQLSKIKLPFQILAGGVWGPTYVVAIPPVPGAQATPTPVTAASPLAAPGVPAGLPTP